MVNVQQEIHKHGTLPLFLAAINREVSSSQYRGRGKGEDVKKKNKKVCSQQERAQGRSLELASTTPTAHTYTHTHAPLGTGGEQRAAPPERGWRRAVGVGESPPGPRGAAISTSESSAERGG